MDIYEVTSRIVRESNVETINVFDETRWKNCQVDDSNIRGKPRLSFRAVERQTGALSNRVTIPGVTFLRRADMNCCLLCLLVDRFVVSELNQPNHCSLS
jgi:hypothetical protein